MNLAFFIFMHSFPASRMVGKSETPNTNADLTKLRKVSIISCIIVIARLGGRKTSDFSTNNKQTA